MVYFEIKTPQFGILKLLLNKDITIKNVVQKSLAKLNLDKSTGRLSINGDIADENKKLSEYLQPINNAVLIIQ